ncbi:hypothetical protein FRB97_005351 [Tulasnella sp. 331]|nr:hypothetical protein FRB97_005351 [Tulasnella sp. 331]
MTTSLENVKRPKYRPEVFGVKSNFWDDYNKISGLLDSERFHRLSDNLDAMLIFAGLFSGVNITFISFSVASLSPSPSDETNALLRLLIATGDNSTSSALASIASTASTPQSQLTSVRVNCLLFASLSCSLLSAAGAVTAKQWLARCQRPTSIHTPDEQGRIRQKKFRGVERWHFEAVLEGLPSLLMLSFALFSAAVVDYLWNTSKPVAYVGLSFTMAGLVAYANIHVRKEIVQKPDLRLLIAATLEYNWYEFMIEEMDLVEAEPMTRLLFLKGWLMKMKTFPKETRGRIIGQLFDALAALLMSLEEKSIDDALISSISLLLFWLFTKNDFDPTPAIVLRAYSGQVLMIYEKTRLDLLVNLNQALKTFTTAKELVISDGSHLKLGSLATVHAVLIAYIPLSQEDLPGLAQHGDEFCKSVGITLSCLLDTKSFAAHWSPHSSSNPKSLPSGCTPISKGKLFQTVLTKLDDLSRFQVHEDLVGVLWRAAEHVHIPQLDDQDQAVAMLHLLCKCPLIDKTGERFSRCIKLHPHAFRLIVEGLSWPEEHWNMPPPPENRIKEAALQIITEEYQEWFSLKAAYSNDLCNEWLKAGLGPTLLALLKSNDLPDKTTLALCSILATLWTQEQWLEELDTYAILEICLEQLKRDEGICVMMMGKLLLSAWPRLSDGMQILERRHRAYAGGVLNYMHAVVKANNLAAGYTHRQRRAAATEAQQALAKVDPGTFQLLKRFIQSLLPLSDLADELREAFRSVEVVL